ncbi:NCS1 family nucleobase:cation symporter-1 [Candidatus Pelagibacter sp.]|nr:NCS1 family nucleobase:cation symporter-1 [Candidatus Pelagibacter sp.]MDC0405221.1 NCS1 family nucleobase:cation symporter-1 [Candidatus Pelagibacter sp.]MDC0428163.1 NCS1 family nucleobase:cation symporter-1 [Candidatus Pelagibacter sp.]
MGRSSKLYNSDLAPTPASKKNWGWFEIFNVWANDVQSLFGYTLAASLFLASGLNGWAVFAALILAGFFIMWLVNLSGKPSVKHGIPYPVFARVSMGVFGANFPAMARGLVAMFWYGAQTYAASTAVALLITGITGIEGEVMLLGMTGVMWVSFIFVSAFQVYLFWQGVDLVKKFLNFAGPAVYAVMILLMIVIWAKAGGGLFSEVGTIFSGGERTGGFEGLGSFGAFLAVFSIMVGYFAAVVINFGDFARFVKNEDEMRKGNLWGLVGNVILFSFITLMITGGTIAIFGEYVSSPTEMVAKVDNLGLTIIAAFAFFAATVGINMVANFIPPAYDLANLMPSKINFKTGGLITAGFGFVIGGMWVAVITQMGLFPFVNTLGAILAPVFGIMMVDYYIIKKEKLDVDALFDDSSKAKYHYNGGFNYKGMLAWILSGYIAVGTVWPNILILGLGDFFANLGGGGGYAWIIGASLGAVVHLAISKR